MREVATAVAHPNIALVKYWGKREVPGNVPAVPSLSITLDGICTRTEVCFDPALDRDVFELDGARASESESARVSACLDVLRRAADSNLRAHVASVNEFPTGAGLASSASGFAALAVAAAAALDLDISARELSGIARASSASAARSLFGGFVTLDPDDEALAAPLLDAETWPLEVVIAVCDSGRKAVGSTSGMRASAETSPFYPAWVESAWADYRAAAAAVRARDFDALGEVTEHSTLKMHAVMQSTRPPLVYWNGATMGCIQRVRELRAAGEAVFFTVDAGPQLKAVCAPGRSDAVAEALSEVAGVQQIIRSGLGHGASCLNVEVAP